MDTEVRPGNGEHRRTGYDRRTEERDVSRTEPAEKYHTELETAAGGSTVTAVTAIGALVLGILSLVGVIPRILMPIGIISAGVALAAIGAAISARFEPLLSKTHDRRFETAVGGGLATETMGGLGVIALGILSLVGVATMTLAAVAVIGFGGALLLGSGSTWELSELNDVDAARARESVKAASGGQILVGLGCVALGILALIGLAPMTLIEVALIAFGAATMLSSAVVGRRVATVLRR